MSSALKRVHSATGTVALVVALLALFASAAGVGYAAATVGTNDIKKNAVTASKIKKNAVTSKKIKKNAVNSVKVKDGSLAEADLVPEEKQIAAALGNGGEGDCVWQSAGTLIPGLVGLTYRKDRSSVVHLTGYAIASDGAGGDADCDPSGVGQVSDGIAFTLPASHMPAKSLISIGAGNGVIIVGPQGLTVGPTSLPPGAVYVGDGAALIEGITYDAAGSSVVLAKVKASGQASGALAQLLR